MTTTEPPGGPDPEALSRLSERRISQLRQIFQDHVLWQLHDAAAVPHDTPEAVLLLAQPGAGGSVVRHRLTADFEQRGAIVAVSVDDFRVYAPGHDAALHYAPHQLAELTEPAARWLSHRAVEYAREQRWNVLIEDTSGHAGRIMATAYTFADDGYHVRIAAVATPPALSRLAIIDAATREAEATGTATWINPQYHDTQYAAINEALQRAQNSPAIARITVETRDGIIHDTHRDPTTGAWRSHSPALARRHAAQALTEARSEPLSRLQSHAVAHRLTDAIERLNHLGAYEPDIDEMASKIVDELTYLGADAIDDIDSAVGNRLLTAAEAQEALADAYADLEAANDALDHLDSSAPTPGPNLPPPLDTGPEPDLGP